MVIERPRGTQWSPSCALYFVKRQKQAAKSMPLQRACPFALPAGSMSARGGFYSPASFFFIRALTSFLMSGTGIFLSNGKWTADLVVSYPLSSFLCSSTTGGRR
jgi:hypothetical protein